MATNGNPLLDLNFIEQFRLRTRRELIEQMGEKLGRAAYKEIADRYAKAGNTYQDLVIEFNNQTNRTAVKRVNVKLAKLMREAMLDAYRTNVLGELAAAPYRKDDRFSFGKLYRALKDSSMAVGSESGIAYINQDLLDQAAWQWKRLNYGAAPGEGRNPGFPHRKGFVRFGQGQGFPVELSPDERPGFNIPEAPAISGHFNPKGQFFIGFPKKDNINKFRKSERGNFNIIKDPRPTKGIAARNFLDAGVVAFAENFGPLYREMLEDADRKAAAKVKNVRIRGK